MPRRLPLCLACSLALLGPAVGLASGLRGELSVERGPGALACPDAAGLAARVAAVVGRPLIVAAGRGDLSMEVQMSCAPEGCQARIRTRGASRGVRDLSDPDPTCEGLADALAITLAMLLDWSPSAPSSAVSSAPSAVSPAVSSVAPSASLAASSPASGAASSSGPPTVSPPTSASPAEGAAPWSLVPRSFGVVTGGGVATGVLPSAAALASLEFEAQWAPWWQLSLVLEGTAPQTLNFQGGTVDLFLLSESLVGCVPARLGRVEIGGCAALSFGQFEASGSGYEQNDSALRLWWLAGLGAEARGPLSGALGWTLRGLVEAQPTGQKVTVGTLGTAAQIDRVGLRVRAGLTWSIW